LLELGRVRGETSTGSCWLLRLLSARLMLEALLRGKCAGEGVYIWDS